MSQPDTFRLSESIKKLLTREACEQLDLEGYVVFDEQPLPDAAAKEYLREVKQCFHEMEGGKIPNQVEFLTSDGPVKLTKPHIYECDLHQAHIRQQLPYFEALFDGDLGRLVEVLRDRACCCEDLRECGDATTTASAVTLKLQMNEGGAFPWHYDNPGRPNKRRLTMAVYLTEDWTPEVGGELQVMPFLGPCVTVPPRLCTIALFKSDLTLHRVLPIRQGAARTRYCFTVWFDGETTNTDEDQYLKVTHLQESAIPFLRRSAVQRTLSRAVYAEEYVQSLKDCFGSDTVACKISLVEHEAHLKQLLKNSQVASFVKLLREYREDT